MIAIQNITEIIEGIKAENSKARINPPLMEKMCYALYLAEQLKNEGLDFIFKGGTCLILLLDFPERFSVDIDIITQAKREDIEAILDRITQKSQFSSYSLDEKRSYKEGIPKAHYKLLFAGQYTDKGDNQILLDILLEENPYPLIESIDCQKDWLPVSEPIIVLSIPSIEFITGDKLTAFAPNTTGIPYGAGKSTEIIKQMFDLGKLFDKVEDLETLKKAYHKIVNQEIAYRKLNDINAQDVLEDTFRTCVAIVKENKQEEHNQELQKAVRNFKNWTIQRFNRDDAFEAAGKVAYLVAKLLSNDTSPLLKAEETTENKQYLIEHPDYNFLNKTLKKLNNFALFYWYQAVRIISERMKE